MRIVSPYRPFQPESEPHLALGVFDWVGALEMLRRSARASCRCETFALTDVDTPLPGPTLAFVTRRRRLMLWVLEVCLTYLSSPAFDVPTAMVSPDVLVLQDLRPYLRADLGVVVRLQEKFLEAGRPLLNAVQFWHPRAKVALVAFYTRALAIAESLPEDLLRWGGDTVPLVRLLEPLVIGEARRADLAVEMFEAQAVLGCPVLGTPRPPTPCVDFKYQRKAYMRAYFEEQFVAGVRA